MQYAVAALLAGERNQRSLNRFVETCFIFDNQD
jgi:hypothetical protein